MSGKNLSPEYARQYHAARTELPATAAYHRSLNQALLRRLPSEGGQTVLDNMCGTGIFLPDLARRYTRVVGVDLSEAMLHHAAAAASTVAQGDSLSLPFADASFDVVVCRGGLHEIPEMERAFAECARVLKQSGTLLVLEPFDDSTVVRFIRRVVYHWSGSFDPAEERGLTSAELRRLAEQHGLSTVDISPYGLVAYVLLCNADVFPMTRLLSKLPKAAGLGRLLAALDERMASVPLLRSFCFQLVGTFAKAAA